MLLDCQVDGGRLKGETEWSTMQPPEAGDLAFVEAPVFSRIHTVSMCLPYLNPP
jgi:hypothetical protein